MYKSTTRNFRANNQDQIVLPAGNYRGIGLSFEGTNDTGQTLAITDYGIIRLYNPQGGKVWDFTLDRLWGLNDRKQMGVQQFSSTISSTIQTFFYIPFHHNQDHNICRLGGGYVLEYQHASLTTITTALTLTVMMQRGLGVQRYFPIYQDYNIRSLSAESTPEEFPRKNLAYVTLTPTANVTNVRFEKDGNTIYDATDEQMDFLTNVERVADNAYNAPAASTNPWVIDLYKERNLAQVLGSNYKYGAVTSDNTIVGMTVEFMITDAALDQTSQIIASVKDKNAETPAEKSVA